MIYAITTIFGTTYAMLTTICIATVVPEDIVSGSVAALKSPDGKPP
jgi:hypothetical protein